MSLAVDEPGSGSAVSAARPVVGHSHARSPAAVCHATAMGVSSALSEAGESVMAIRRSLSLIVILLLAGHTGSALGAGTGGSDSIDIPNSAPRSPEQAADRYYRDGVRHKERAWKQEEKAAKAKNDASRDKALARARKEYQRAIEYQVKALQTLPTHHEAANELGYALRKTGDYRRAIGAYNLALQLKPDFWQAVEYRGEALLAMGYFDETKDAYMTLVREDQDLAAQLMNAIESWLAQQPSDSEDAQALAPWVADRKSLTGFLTEPERAAGAW